MSDIDWFLLGLALAIAVIGVVEIYSTTLALAPGGPVQETDLLAHSELHFGAGCKPA